jgi:rpiB_lacA_lacB: sugar-phosphate isomerases, RpiB/LacA/LacB family
MIALGCDHGGFELKQEIKKHLDQQNIEYIDYGCDSQEAVDYPVYAKKWQERYRMVNVKRES